MVNEIGFPCKTAPFVFVNLPLNLSPFTQAHTQNRPRHISLLLKVIFFFHLLFSLTFFRQNPNAYSYKYAHISLHIQWFIPHIFLHTQFAHSESVKLKFSSVLAIQCALNTYPQLYLLLYLPIPAGPQDSSD